jgi:predicted DNA-binding transcriptional regulator AlpA
MTENDDAPLTHGQAARFIGASVPTLKRILASGQGPAPTRINDRTKFRPSVLREWLEARTGQEST